MTFDKLSKKASELEMIYKHLETEANVSLLASETIHALEEFIDFSAKIGNLLDNKKIMSVGTLNADITNHFIKEHKYFINKLKACVL